MLVSTDQLKSETDVVPEQKAYLAKGIKASTRAARTTRAWSSTSAAAMNIGVMWFRDGGQPRVDEWVKLIEAKDELWDQNAFNDLVRLGGSCSVKPDGSGLMRGSRENSRGCVAGGTRQRARFPRAEDAQPKSDGPVRRAQHVPVRRHAGEEAQDARGECLAR